MILKTVLSTGLILCALAAVSGQKHIRGTVTDNHGEAILFASVVVEPNHHRGTTTDLDGIFALDVYPTDSLLLISYVGYLTKQVALSRYQDKRKDTLDIDFVLLENPGLVDPIMIIAEPELVEEIHTEQLTLPAETTAKQPSVDRLLNTIPGVYMQSGSLNTNRLTIRGNGNRSPFATSGIKIYVDDIPIHENNGNSALEDFGTNILAKARILKGPTGPGYGSGLSGGVVINTDASLYSQKSYAQTYTEAGAYGTLRTANTLELNSKPNSRKPTHHLRLLQSYVHTDGYRTNNEVQRNNMTVNYRLKTRGHTLKLLANIVQLDAQIPGALNLTDYTANPRQAAPNWDAAEGYETYQRALLGGTYQYQYGLENKASITAYTRGHESEELRPFNVIRDTTSTYGVRGKVDHFIDLQSGSMQLTAGHDMQVEQYDFTLLQTAENTVGDFISTDDWATISHHTYINSTLRLDSGWDIDLGQEYAQYHTQGLTERNVQSGLLLPSASVTKRLTWTRLYTKVSRGATFPTPQQLAQNQVALVEGLNPTYGWNYEAGLKGYKPKYALGYRLAVYHMNVEDEFVQRAGPDDTPFLVNAGSTALSGIEWSLRKAWPLSQESKIQTSVASAHTLHRFDRFEDQGVSYDGNSLPGSPHWTLHADATYQSKMVAVSLIATHVSSYLIDDANTVENEAYTIVNTTIDYYVVNNSHWKVSVHIRGENLTDRRYASMTSVNAQSFGGQPRYYYGGQPANFSGGIVLKYQW